MSKRVFVVDDPNVASEVEALLRSRGLSRTNVENEPNARHSINSRMVPPQGIHGRLNEDLDAVKMVNDHLRAMHQKEQDFPFFKRLGVRNPRRMEASVSPSPFGWRDGAMAPRKLPYEMSCGTFTPPTPPSRLFVGGACGGYEVADARDLMMGRQLYRSNGCGGFEPISYPSGGCGGTTHDIGGCGGWRTNYIRGCGGTTYRSGC